MKKPENRTSTNIEVIPATSEQEPVVAHLFQLYAHDFSEFIDLKLEADGRFRYDWLPSYWSKQGRHPLLVKVDGCLAGFVLLKQGSEVSGDANVWDVAEFFVARGFRRHGIGTAVAHHVWRQFPGRWEVRVMQINDSARQFWAYAIKAFTGESVEPVPVEKDGRRWNLFSFESHVDFSQ